LWTAVLFPPSSRSLRAVRDALSRFLAVDRAD